eukprot:g26426.t1
MDCWGGRGLGTVLCYNGRRQTGRVRCDDGEELLIPSGGAVNRNMVPLTPSGLMHGTRVQLLPDGHEKKAVSVRPAEAKQQGLTVGVDNQVNYRGEDRSELCAADVLDIGFLIGILDGHCGGQCASHVANGFPKILHDVYGFEVNQTRGVDTLSCARETELLRDVLRSSCRAAERDLTLVVDSAGDFSRHTTTNQMLTASKGHWTDGTSAMFALLAHGFDEEGAPVTVPGTKGVAKVFLASRCALPGTVGAWCGDTRALLLHGRKVVPLSEDHVPKRKDEYNRVKAAGGKVLDFDGKLKVGRRDKYKEKKSSGAYKDLVWLETTRSFGDIRLKAPHNIAPRVHGFDRIGIAPALSMNLAPEDWALVLVSSKVTAKMSNQDIAEVCKEYFSQGKDAVAASQALTTAARKRGATGNLTTVVMRFGWPPGCNGDDTGKVGWREGSGAACLGELFEFLGVCLGVESPDRHWPDFSKPEESAAVFGLVFAASNIARLLLPLRFGAALAMAPWVDENIMQKCFNVAAWTKSLAMTLLRAPRGRKSAESLSLTIPWEALGRGAQAERPAEEPMTESSRGSLVLGGVGAFQRASAEGMQKTLAHATAVTTCATRGASDLASALCSQGCRMTLHASDSVKSTAEVLQSQGPKIAHVVCATSSALCQGAAELKAALQTAAEKLPNPPAEKPPNTGVRGLRRRTDTPERRPDGVAHAAPLAPVQRRGDGEAARELKVRDREGRVAFGGLEKDVFWSGPCGNRRCFGVLRLLLDLQ